MESITKVSPIKEIGEKNTLLTTVNKRAMYDHNTSKTHEVPLSAPKPKKGYKNFQEVYNDFQARISQHFVNGLKHKDPLKFYSEVYRYMAISILSAQLGLKISYQDKAKYKQFVDSFIEDHWINYKDSVSDSWVNFYPDSFSDQGGHVKSPGNKDMSIYIQVGNEDWEKIRISDHAIMSNTTATVMGIISKDTFEKLLFKSDGNILNFINEVKKEYDNFIEKGINSNDSIKKIANIVVQYENKIKDSISKDKFLNKQDVIDIKNILDKIIFSNGNSANIIKSLSDDERKKLIGVINHQIISSETRKYIRTNQINPHKEISVSIDDVNGQSGQEKLFDINKIINNYI